MVSTLPPEPNTNPAASISSSKGRANWGKATISIRPVLPTTP